MGDKYRMSVLWWLDDAVEPSSSTRIVVRANSKQEAVTQVESMIASKQLNPKELQEENLDLLYYKISCIGKIYWINLVLMI